MKNPTTIDITIEGTEAFDEVKIIMDKYIALTKNLNSLAALGIDVNVIENILVAVKPTYERGERNV